MKKQLIFLLCFCMVANLSQAQEAGNNQSGLPLDSLNMLLELDEVTVKAYRPVRKLTGDGLAIDIEHTVLSKAGTGDDVLSRIPGITKKDDGYEVIGKGTPLIYINGRQMRDQSELDQLKSEDIKSVEVITSPGARYDASVKSVIRIKTKPVQGEGFGFDVRSSYYQGRNADFIEQMNYNYRHNQLDIFGTLQYNKYGQYMKSELNQTVYADTLWQQTNNHIEDYSWRRFRNITGLNYAFNDNHSLGMKYTLMVSPAEHLNLLFKSDIRANGAYYDKMENYFESKDKDYPSHLVNAYYNGTIGKTTIDFNADYMYSRNKKYSQNNEKSQEKESRIVTSYNNVKNHMFAAKLVVGQPLFGGNLTIGAEYINTHRNDNYINPEGIVPTSYSQLKEQRIAPFIEYAHVIPIGHLSAGLRYEHVAFDYEQNGKRLEEQSRSFDNLFPNISLATKIGNVQTMLSYSVKTVRPTYWQLSNNVTYANRFTMETGNPLLKYQIVHGISLQAMWKFMQFSASYTDNCNAILNWAEQLEENPAITLMSQQNFKSLKSLTIFAVASPRFGIYTPQLSVAMQKQFFRLNTLNGEMTFNKPVWSIGLNNSFDFGKGWTASLDMNFTSKGNAENVYLYRRTYLLNVAITKTWMNDRLSLQLKGSDLLNKNVNGYEVQNWQMNFRQLQLRDTQEVGITLRYKFNTTRSKYKGTGAGNEEINRL